MGRSGIANAIWWAFFITVAAHDARAQTNSQANSGIIFNFSNPGSRSLGLGGAFIGLADDATAAFSNPAGLINLKAPEVSIEGRNFAYTHEFPDSGHEFGTPSGIGQDTMAGVHNEESHNSLASLSFLSFVYPRERWSIAVYRDQVADFEATTNMNGTFFGPSSNTLRVPPAISDFRMDIAAYGVASAFKFGGGFSAGLGVAYYTYTLDSLSRIYDTMGANGPPDYTMLMHTHSQTGSDTDFGVNVGLLWDISKKWRAGAVYRSSVSFALDAVKMHAEGDIEKFKARLNVPDLLGVGAAFNPTESIRVTADYDFVRYSKLTDGFSVVEMHDATGEEFGTPMAQDYKVDDASEIHLGFEYLFLVKYPVAVRAGVWTDPDHRIRYTGPVALERVLFPSGDNQVHYAAGVGLVVKRLKFDAAVDFSNRVDTASLSVVASF